MSNGNALLFVAVLALAVGDTADIFGDRALKRRVEAIEQHMPADVGPLTAEEEALAAEMDLAAAIVGTRIVWKYRDSNGELRFLADPTTDPRLQPEE